MMFILYFENSTFDIIVSCRFVSLACDQRVGLEIFQKMDQ